MVNWLKVCSVAFLASLIVSGCAQTSGGMVLGVKGSPAWFKFAPKSDVRMHVDSMSTVRLCSGWADAWETPIVREAISGALVRRGKESMYCYNPQDIPIGPEYMTEEASSEQGDAPYR